MAKNDGGPAFPVPMIPVDFGFTEVREQGLSLRNWFAANASLDDCEEMSVRSLGKVLGREPPNFEADPIGYMEWDAAWRAKVRYLRADAMLAERGKA